METEQKQILRSELSRTTLFDVLDAFLAERQERLIESSMRSTDDLLVDIATKIRCDGAYKELREIRNEMKTVYDEEQEKLKP